METKAAAASLSALGHEGRLAIFRLLVSAGPQGLAAGDIAKRLGMIPNTLSANLNILGHAGLTNARREGRSIIHTADFDAMSGLLGFLVGDCCGGSPDICAPLNAILINAASCTPPLPADIGARMTRTADHQPLNVLFLCTHNSARSVLAESILNREGAGRFKAYSAGSMPSGKINPDAITLLQKLNYKTGDLRSKSWEEFALADNPDAPRLDFVFTVCDNAAGEVCPIWPGQPMTAHWGISDPSTVSGTDVDKALAFAEAYRQLNSRITLFCALPMASLDRLSLQRRLDDIGKSPTTAA